MTRNIVTIEENTVTTAIADCWEITGSNGCRYCVMEAQSVSYPAVICYKLWSATATLVMPRPPPMTARCARRSKRRCSARAGPCLAATNVMVTDSVVELWGWFETEAERRAMIVAAEEDAGMQKVIDHLGAMPPRT